MSNDQDHHENRGQRPAANRPASPSNENPSHQANGRPEHLTSRLDNEKVSDRVTEKIA
ncbi:hypothetical protein FF80_03726 [Devosia sp. LC5]|nr:hypothetical protein FF80_03726 [Devosia sp. LC5]